MAIPLHNDVSRQLRRGVRHIEAAYRDAGDTLGGRGGEKVWRRSLRGAFAKLIADARFLTPRDTGRLQGRLDVRPATRRERKEDFFAVSFGFFGPRPYFKAVAIEFGNVKVRESAPLRRAWQANEGEVVADAIRGLADEMDKITDELARKLRQSRATE